MPANRNVVLSEAAYRQIQTYAILTGISIDHAASEALSEWMRTTGNLLVEALQKMQRTSAAKPKLTIVSGAGPSMDTASRLRST